MALFFIPPRSLTVTTKFAAEPFLVTVVTCRRSPPEPGRRLPLHAAVAAGCDLLVPVLALPEDERCATYREYLDQRACWTVRQRPGNPSYGPLRAVP
jgi:hypothetical protein